MGLIPIFLAIAGMVFLMSLVAYHSYKNKREYVRAAAAQLVRLKQSRNDILLQLYTLFKINGLALPVYLTELANGTTLEDATRTTAAIAETDELGRRHPELHEGPDFPLLLESLQQTEVELRKARRLHTTGLFDYNRQVSEMPYRIIAKLFGFEKMAMEAV